MKMVVFLLIPYLDKAPEKRAEKTWHFGRTKTTNGEQDDTVYLTGWRVEALNAWLAAANIESGSVFQGIGR